MLCKGGATLAEGVRGYAITLGSDQDKPHTACVHVFVCRAQQVRVLALPGQAHSRVISAIGPLSHVCVLSL